MERMRSVGMIRRFIASAVLALFAWLVPAVGMAQPKDGQVYKDWTVRCQPDPQNAAKDGCFIFQSVVDNQSKKPIMAVAVGYLVSDKGPAAVFTVPLGIRLPPGVQVQIDQNQSLKLPVERCMPDGCRIQFRLADTHIAAFKAGSGGTLTFQDVTGRNVAIPFSLSGFTAAFASLQ